MKNKFFIKGIIIIILVIVFLISGCTSTSKDHTANAKKSEFAVKDHTTNTKKSEFTLVEKVVYSEEDKKAWEKLLDDFRNNRMTYNGFLYGRLNVAPKSGEWLTNEVLTRFGISGLKQPGGTKSFIVKSDDLSMVIIGVEPLFSDETRGKYYWEAVLEYMEDQFSSFSQVITLNQPLYVGGKFRITHESRGYYYSVNRMN